MNKKFVISVVVLFVATMLTGFVVHGLLLEGIYQTLTPHLFRPPEDAQNYFGYMILAHVFIAVGLTWFYRRGHRPAESVIVQGLSFGVAMVVMTTLPTYLIYFAVQPTPVHLVVKQIVFDGIAMLLLGVLTAWLNKA